MKDFATFIFVQMPIAAMLVLLGITAWCGASRVTEVSSEPSRTTNEVLWYRIVGWFFAWAGALGLFAMAVIAAVMAFDRTEVTAFPLISVVLAILALISLISLVRVMINIRDTFVVPPNTSLTTQTSWLTSRGLNHPLALSAISLVGTLVLLILCQALFLFPNQQLDALIAIAMALLASLISFFGLVFIFSAELIVRPWVAEESWFRTTLSRLLSLFAFAFLFAAVCLLVLPGLILILLIGVLLVSTLGGRRRAAELSTFWTLSHAVKTGAPLGTELAAQAAAATGRSSYLLGMASQQLEKGVPLEEVAFTRGLVPSSSWLEVSAAMSTGRLPTALEAAAARETERFSRAWSPGVARGSLAYFGVLGFGMLFIVGFLMYYIIPKFKKIFEDFDTELPYVSVSLINFSDLSVNYLLWLPGLGLAFSLIAIELLADYYGWEGLLERFGSRYRLRFATPDLLRGLKWAVVTRQPLDPVLEDMAATPVSFLVKSGLHRTAVQIRDGAEPWSTLHGVGWIRREEADLLRCAQAAGNLPWALDTLSQSLGQRRAYRIEWWLQAIHPVLVIAGGLFVGWIAIAMFMPLVKLLNDLS